MHEAADSEIGLRAAAGNRLRVHANRSGRVSAPASNPQKTSTGAWHKRLCYGFCQPGGLRKRFFYSLVGLLSGGVIAELFLFLPNPITGGEVLRGTEPLSKWPRGVFCLKRFLFVLPGESSFSSGNLLSAGALAKSHASTMTYSGQEEERAPSIYRTGPSSPEALTRVRRSKVFSLT